MSFIVEDLKKLYRSGDVLLQLIIANVIIYILVNIINNFFPLESYLTLPASFSELISKPWAIVSYMFLHDSGSLSHIFWNLLILYFMGRLLREYVTPIRFTAIYFFGGILGGLLFMVAFSLFYNGNGYLLGASAAVMSVVFAAATLVPNNTLHLFLIGPVKVKYIALGILVISTVLNFSVNTGGKIAHLGGAFYGYWYIRSLKNGTDHSQILQGIINLFRKKEKSKLRMVKPDKRQLRSDESYNEYKKNKQKVIDSILDKINRSGYDSLSPEERRILNESSKK